MFGWWQRGGKTPGWLAVTFDEARLEFAHARRARVTRELKLGRYQCSTMLRAGEYDILLVDEPNVPRAEMKSALRWKVKGMVDYSMDGTTLDFLTVPTAGA